MQLFPWVVGNEAAPTGSDLAMLAGLAEGAEVTMLSDYDIEPVIALALAAAVS